MRTARLEAFSDGVIAIAITLLVLDLKVPELGGDLLHELGRQWPSYSGYLVSFVTIGIMWVNHHALFDRVAKVDHWLLYLNLFLLLGVGTLPFTTSLAARFLRSGAQGRQAMVIYTVSLLFVGLMYLAIWGHLAKRPALLAPGVTPAAIRRSIRRTVVGPACYALAVAVACVDARASLLLCGLVAAYFVLPGRA